MANTGPKVATAAAVLAVLMGARSSFADPATTRTVVLHVTDYELVPGGLLAEAQKAASDVYARIGVRLVWTDGSAKLAAADGSLHLDVTILNATMTARRAPAPGTFGQASYITRCAYIYYRRIIWYALQSGSDPARVLALVLAHEVGHMLLPEYSHAPSGLMRATWDRRIVHVPDFMPAQAATIRTMLTSAE
jgi:hypothetical protein